jgi:glycosyltransferase involved in cell wall biosynthesis
LCHGFLVSGKRAKAHFSGNLRLPENRIKPPYSVVDNDHFAAAKPDYGRKKILCLARFSPEKNLLRLVEAFRQSGIAGEGWQLELVGGGPQQQELENAECPGLILQKWVSYESLPQLYASASGFILPSSFEPWGLVVNEAMAAGLPVAVSEECGCAPDLVNDASLCFPAGNTEKMAGVLKRLAGMSPEEKRKAGEYNRVVIEKFSPGQWAGSFMELAFA